MRNPQMLLQQGASVRFRTSILNPDGTVAKRNAWRRNLILDQGLDQAGTRSWPDCFLSAAAGTGTTATETDSGATTASRSGTTVTASAGIFTAGMVGMLIRWDSGEEAYIASFTSATVVETTTSGAIASAEFTVYAVNQTGLTTEVKRTTSYVSGANGTTWNAPSTRFEHTRTFIFSAEAGTVTYNEVGWSPDAGAGANLFGRAIISPGDTLVAGQQYQIEVILSIALSPVSITAVGDVGNNGFNTAGNATIEYVGQFSRAAVQSTGASDNQYAALDPGNNSNKSLQVRDDAFTQVSPPATADNFSGGIFAAQLVAAAYSNGNFFRDWSYTCTTAQANGTLTGLCVGETNRRAFSVKFTAGQTKDSSHTLTVTFRIAWQRQF